MILLENDTSPMEALGYPSSGSASRPNCQSQRRSVGAFSKTVIASCLVFIFGYDASVGELAPERLTGSVW